LNTDLHTPYIDRQTALFWFRRDLRLADQAGLFYALMENDPVLPVFIFDTSILNRLEDPADARVTFIHHRVTDLKRQLEEMNTSLLVFHGNPVEIFKQLNPKAVYANHDYEPYARKRDEAVRNILSEKGIAFKTYKDQVIFERKEIMKEDGSPYTVFTPYSKKWKAQLKATSTTHYLSEKHFTSFKKVSPALMPSLEQLGFRKSLISFPARAIKQSVIENYHLQRNYPAMESTTRLSVHLRFGTVSIRKLVALALKKNETWLNELIWREFYHMILWHFPNVEKAFKPAYDKILWRNDESEFQKWCEGKTGYPLVDAGMRELNATGFMHNRVRMVVASFLTKHLLIDWRWGEAYFAKKLLDFDLAANNGGWQWAAGCGCDAAPYFRVFNPVLQATRFDPQSIYIKKWIPEIETPGYPGPIVDPVFARNRALRVYKDALGK
jgi:deoxyribodipyrimidine photo-lyase